MKHFYFVFMVVLFFSGCSSKIPTLEDRKNIAQSLINDKSVVQKDIKTDTFTLFSFQKVSNECKNSIKIYIEGDGLSWISRNVISSNPTPLNPTSLKLMLLDDSSCKIYIARPCQYTTSTICEEKYWTNERFSKEILDSFNEALNSLKKEYSNHNFNLLGYSGGGAIVTLLASQRNDINSITTIAGNLDIEKWTNIHNISSLNGSLNPADFSNTLENIKQHHLIGEDDKIIPKEIFFSYQSKFRNKKNITYSLHKATHNCCWEDIYKKYLLEN
ncbi:alpha/beta fold hydrolase [Aliarcobacter cryaerophilus]|uniref:alpha/beta fold hydrolase n=1 Tax=Aliarcobacter cryaerophilus TaxID=28198 RepID=UPI000837254B|nr:alpha/beta fold hydrolase [Aliarcobacter cryaerophilus]